jgi:hypothetical protein
MTSKSFALPATELTARKREEFLRNGGKFPFEKVYRMVDGRKMIDSHKRFAMPFWGNYLQKQGHQFTPESNAAAKQRIIEIVRYVETIQKK